MHVISYFSGIARSLTVEETSLCNKATYSKFRIQEVAKQEAEHVVVWFSSLPSFTVIAYQWLPSNFKGKPEDNT